MSKLSDSIIKLREDGKSVNEISNILNCSKGTISYHINKHGLGGIKVKRKKMMDGDIINTISDDIIQTIINLREDNKTYNEIISEVDISLDNLKRVCRVYGLTKPNNRKICDNTISNIREEYLKLRSLRKVAKKFKMNRGTVGKYCSDLISTPKIVSPEEHKKKNIKYVNDFRVNRKKKLVEYKGGKCVGCGYSKSIRALHFHHIDPSTKEFNIGSSNYNMDRMLIEVDKCILVCSNCHSEIHEELEKYGESEIINLIK
jgi:DNA invertase Pin-like site-specific DNA recombinase